MVQRPTTANLEMPSNTGKTCFEDADLHDINDNLFWSTYTISKSPADGHCFMYSVVTTFIANMSDNSVNLDVDVLSAKLSNETMANSHEYINYIEFINSDDGTGIPSLRLLLQVRIRTMLLLLVQWSLLQVNRAQIMLWNVIPLTRMHGMKKSG